MSCRHKNAYKRIFKLEERILFLQSSFQTKCALSCDDQLAQNQESASSSITGSVYD